MQYHTFVVHFPVWGNGVHMAPIHICALGHVSGFFFCSFNAICSTAQLFAAEVDMTSYCAEGF